jgi:hypothetical protein
MKRNFLCFNVVKKTDKHIGVHNKTVISILVVCLLGAAHAEKRNNATRFIIHVSSRNVEYIYFLHKFFAKNGYCNLKKPKISKQIGKNNKIYFSIKFKTFSFSSFNFLHDAFYNEKKEKIVPLHIHKLLTAEAFAIWFMGNGDKSGSELKIFTDKFPLKHVICLQKAIHENFKILPTIQHHKKYKSEKLKQDRLYGIYFKKRDKHNVLNIVKDFLVDSMVYKFK